ncbi:WXG100 family type VII secretion target [Brachybacterium squillarum]|uniref:WXG100 family type VII secretion target n=1 Tax=Brachybacterium squillarum TaxID=661979 RepID=UPI00026297AA|nr:alpha/beta hydrolase [Brachybacterium squillarum]
MSGVATPGFWGMDTARVQEAAEAWGRAAEVVAALRDRLARRLTGTAWHGADAEALRGRWWKQEAPVLDALGHELADLAAGLREHAAQQDETSAVPAAASAPVLGGAMAAPAGARAAGPSPTAPSPARPQSTAPPPTLPTPAAALPQASPGYLHRDALWLPDGVEAPLELAGSHLAGHVAERLDRGLATQVGLLSAGGELLGLWTADLGQLEGDASHLGDLVEAWASGQRVPTVAELGAAGLVTTGSAAVVGMEALTGRDSPLLDDRPGGRLTDVRITSGGTAPQDLVDLVLGNDALRVPNPEGDALAAGNIGVQTLRPADGGEPVFLVQVPPTEGARIWEAPGAWGQQGASRDWASNLRMVAGQDTAAMDDVRAAMQVAGVPAGSRVMLVGHSQGGIVAARLAADPTFNAPDGASGGYEVTHVLSYGSPVQTVIPARADTATLNVSHAPGLAGLGIAGDPVPLLDLQGIGVDGSLPVGSRHAEVVLPGYPSDVAGWLPANHDATGAGDDPVGGYAGSIARAARTDPDLVTLQAELEGTYLGPGVLVEESAVVTVGRGAVGSG